MSAVTGPGGDLFAAAQEHHSLFFALLPDAAAIAAMRGSVDGLAASLPPQPGPGVDDARLHLTVHWLGEWSQLPDATVDAARTAAATLEAPSFRLRMDQAECFGRGEVIWVLRPACPPAALGQLHADLAAALGRQRLRLPAGPAFAPHVTVRRRAQARFETRAIEPVDWDVAGFALVHSRRAQGAAQYRILGRWALLPAQ